MAKENVSVFDEENCYYCEPLSFLKLKGKIISKEVVRIGVFFQGGWIGDARMDCFLYNSVTKSPGDAWDWCFTKAMTYAERERPVVVIRMYSAQEEVLYMAQIEVKVYREMPKEFVSAIGTKTSITIEKDSEKEKVFWKRQTACGLKPEIQLLHLESASSCNLECKYCLVGNGGKQIDRGVLKPEVLCKAIEAVQEMPELKVIQLSGLGEPLMNPYFIEVCQQIYEKTQIRKLQFFTNGMLFDEKISNALAEIPMDFKITFSIDGRSADENDFYRKGSRYETVKKNLNYFLRRIRGKKNFMVRIHNLVIAGLEEEPKPPAFLLEHFGFLPIDSHRAFYFPDLSKETLYHNQISVFAAQNKKICKRTFQEATIRFNGDIIRCHWDSGCNIVMGNILKQSFQEIWHGEQYIAQRRLMLPDSPFDRLPEVCQSCHAMNSGFLYKRLEDSEESGGGI